MTEYQTHAALVQSLEAEVSRLKAVNAGLAQAARRALEAFPTLDEFFNRYVESIGGPYFGEAARIALLAVRELPRIEGALREALEPASQPARQPLTDKQIASACFSYRHDFGLLSKQEQESIIFQAREWERALEKERGIGGEA